MERANSTIDILYVGLGSPTGTFSTLVTYYGTNWQVDYDGTNYTVWKISKNVDTALIAAMSTYLREKHNVLEFPVREFLRLVPEFHKDASNAILLGAFQNEGI